MFLKIAFNQKTHIYTKLAHKSAKIGGWGYLGLVKIHDKEAAAWPNLGNAIKLLSKGFIQ